MKASLTRKFKGCIPVKTYDISESDPFFAEYIAPLLTNFASKETD